MYTPRQIIAYIAQAYPDDLPAKGDVVLTGTPAGIAMQIPAWKTWLSDILGLNRFAKLLLAIASSRGNERFLKPGDVIEVSGGVLGTVKTQIVR